MTNNNFEVVIESLTKENPLQNKIGTRNRIFLNEEGYKAMMKDVNAGIIKIIAIGVNSETN